MGILPRMEFPKNRFFLALGVFVIAVFLTAPSLVEGKPALNAETREEPYCFICQLLVVSVEMSIIGNNATMEQIVDNAAGACDLLGEEGSNIVQQCHDLIE